MGSAIESVQRYFGNHLPGIDGYRRGTLSMFLTGDVDAREGPASDGVVVGALNVVDFTYGFLDDGGVFSDDTTDLNDVGTADVALMPATEVVNDAFYFGLSEKFTGISITLSTAGVGSAVTFEYYNGHSWVNLATAHNLVDDSAGFTTGTSTYLITWTIPSDWAQVLVGDENASGTAYWVRARVSTASYSTVPVATRGRALQAKGSTGIGFPSNGIVDGVSFTLETASGSTTDLTLQIINATTGASSSVTLLTDVVSGSASLVRGVAFNRGDVLVVQATAADSTEPANMNLVLEFKE